VHASDFSLLPLILPLFVFYTILKPLDRKFAVLFCKNSVRKFRSIPKIGLNFLTNTNIILSFIVFYFSSGLQFKSELTEEIQLNE
jgi:hypothetical protein